ncbi:GrpE-domain-containing protein [Dipodascopsis tothii]|uniref:GrpE-domain-containing protein n=1 Tax=Dipodascopsis tothii TaxID=44089 RepID=UPI0034CDC06B
MYRRLATLGARQSLARTAVVPRIAIARPLVAAPVRRAYSTEEPKEPKAEPAAEDGVAKELADLQAQLADKTKEASDFKDRYLRQVADFRNLQTTTQREVQNAKDFAIQKFAKDLLDSIDNLERALATVPEEKRADGEKDLVTLYEGIQMTHHILENTLKKHGMEKIDPIGAKFDPNEHEATFEIPQADKEPGSVFFVQQTGFKLNNRVLRAAKVGVVKG